MLIRGFAMVNGVSFTDGKRRVTGRILADGTWDIKPGGRWYWRFSPVQRWMFLMILGLELTSYLVSGFANTLLVTLETLLFILLTVSMPRVHRRFHGAEHMVVNRLEGKVASVLHPGCGSNLVLLFLPGGLALFLPLPTYILLGLEVVYAGVVLGWFWPTLYRGLKKDCWWAKKWWWITKRWQGLFVAEPRAEELQLADKVLQQLLLQRLNAG